MITTEPIILFSSITGTIGDAIGLTTPPTSLYIPIDVNIYGLGLHDGDGHMGHHTRIQAIFKCCYSDSLCVSVHILAVCSGVDIPEDQLRRWLEHLDQCTFHFKCVFWAKLIIILFPTCMHE